MWKTCPRPSSVPPPCTELTPVDFFESKLSPDTQLSSKELDEYLTPFNLSRNVEIDKSYANSKNPYFELFLEIMQVEVELFNKLEQQRSIIAMRLQNVHSGNFSSKLSQKNQPPLDPEVALSEIFSELSNSQAAKDQKFVDL